MKKVEVEIQGRTPLLMHKLSKEAQEEIMQKTKKVTRRLDPEEEAERGTYRVSKGDHKDELCIPARCLKACIVNASSWYKVGRRSMKQFIAGGVLIEPYDIPLGTKKYEVDLRPVVIGRGNRVIRARARLDEWKANFTIVYNDEWITDVEILKKILEEAGVRIGILDNRPQKGGENGTFIVTKFKPTK